MCGRREEPLDYRVQGSDGKPELAQAGVWPLREQHAIIGTHAECSNRRPETDEVIDQRGVHGLAVSEVQHLYGQGEA